jgi:hypothetical protein
LATENIGPNFTEKFSSPSMSAPAKKGTLFFACIKMSFKLDWYVVIFEVAII